MDSVQYTLDLLLLLLPQLISWRECPLCVDQNCRKASLEEYRGDPSGGPSSLPRADDQVAASASAQVTAAGGLSRNSCPFRPCVPCPLDRLADLPQEETC